MATTRLIPMHVGKGKTLAKALKARTDYAQNPEKNFSIIGDYRSMVISMDRQTSAAFAGTFQLV